MTTRNHVLILTVLVLLLRLPFLNQAVGGDDVYYLAAADHGLIDPLHPNHTTYVFGGDEVTFQGYPHPPGNAAFLMILLMVFKDVREIPFHAAYILFSLAAIYGAYALARRFSARPLAAALLFAAVPAFVINGNTFESDLPLLAFWMVGAAAYIYAVDRGSRRWLALAVLSLAMAGMIAMQSLLFTPILLSYLGICRSKRTGTQMLAALTPVVALVGWQCFERVTSGQFPALVSANYMASAGSERLMVKLTNALALTIHAAFMVFPVLIPFAALSVWKQRRDPDTRFLLLWFVLFLGGAYILFFAGSARYLLPLAAPLAIMASRAPLRWVQVSIAAQLTLSLLLATVNYEHWNAYRDFARSLGLQVGHRRVWVDAEWGLRHYLEADGALPLHRNQWIPDGDIVVESDLAFPVAIPHGGRALVPIATSDIAPAIPLRLIGLEARSGYSTDSEGLLPFDFRGGLIDRVRAYQLRPQEPALSVLPMNAPDADTQVVSGIYPNEGQPWRWMGKDATLLLKSPLHAATVEVKFYIADTAPARTVTIAVSGGPRLSRTFPGPGTYSMSMPVDATHLSPVTLTIAVDRTFSVPGDNRTLGLILNEAGIQ